MASRLKTTWRAMATVTMRKIDAVYLTAAAGPTSHSPPPMEVAAMTAPGPMTLSMFRKPKGGGAGRSVDFPGAEARRSPGQGGSVAETGVAHRPQAESSPGSGNTRRSLSNRTGGVARDSPPLGFQQVCLRADFITRGDMGIQLVLQAWLVVGLFFGMLLLLELGRRIGARRLAQDPEGARAGVGAVEGAVYGLLGLLIAFTFSGAAARFDARRQLIVEEANDIGTAYLRLDLLPAEPREQLQEKFRRYVDSRLETYRKLPDIRAAEAELARSAGLQNEIWTLAVDGRTHRRRPRPRCCSCPRSTR